MGVIFSSIIRTGAVMERRALARNTLCPGLVQREFLLKLLKQNKDTIYGKKFSFSSIAGEEEFRDSLPVVEYTDIDFHIERIMSGVHNVLTSEPVLMFNMTSGTTGSPKYIPVTRQGLKRTGRLMRQWLCHALSDHPSLLEGHSLCITGAAVEGRLGSGIPFGSASGVINSSLPAWVRNSFAIPSATSEIADYETRYYVMARLSYGKPVSFIATPNPLTLSNLVKTAMLRQEEIVRAIYNGWLSESLRSRNDVITAGIPAAIHPALGPDRSRALFLEKVVERTGRLLPVDCWPDLRLIGCWLGGSIGFHAESLAGYFGSVPLRDIGYMASEGCMTLPLQDHSPSGVLALRNNYYEFIPEAQIDSAHPDILTVCELEPGKCYKVLLTNENGLYRYDINDIVKVEGFHRQTPVISFLRKSGNFLNIAGEKLHLNHCLAAIESLRTGFSLDVHQFRIVPDVKKLRYEFLLDIGPGVPEGFQNQALLKSLDASLCAGNIEYGSRRRSKRLNPPCIHVMGSSWADEARREDARSGRRDVQYKWRQLSAERSGADIRHIRYTIEKEFP